MAKASLANYQSLAIYTPLWNIYDVVTLKVWNVFGHVQKEWHTFGNILFDIWCISS